MERPREGRARVPMFRCRSGSARALRTGGEAPRQLRCADGLRMSPGSRREVTQPQWANTPAERGASSRDVAYHLRPERRGKSRGQMPPHARSPAVAGVVRGRSLCFASARCPIPPERLLAPAPLHLEVMRAAALRAAAEIEGREPRRDGALHHRPVQQHVWRELVVLSQRGGPRQFEFAAKDKTTPGGNRTTIEVRACEPRVVAK